MTARLLDGGDGGVCGVLTSGGTESILLATKAHRDFYRQVNLKAFMPMYGSTWCVSALFLFRSRVSAAVAYYAHPACSFYVEP